MTGLLGQALRRLDTLSADEQDAIASQIIETLDDEKAWADRLAGIPSGLRDMAREAGEEHRRGETRALDEPAAAALYRPRLVPGKPAE